jgi:membrane-bound lytic murein transglycosylase F
VLKAIKQDHKLIVVTRNAPTTYYELHDEFQGLEYDMTQDFARYLGVDVEYVIKDSTSEVLAAIQKGEAHLAAAGLTITPEREADFLFGPIYQQVEQEIVCRRGWANPKKIADLVGLQIQVPVDTSYVENLQHLAQTQADLQWQALANVSTEDLLEAVWMKQTDCTVADSTIVAINRRYYPELRVRFQVTESESLAWVMSMQAGSLNAIVKDWFDEFESSGKLEALLERYYGHVEEFDYVDTRRFVTRIHKVLPKYKKHFVAAGKAYDIDWVQLAAQAYQESHWRAKARSPTGVRGIMMLTLTTAEEMGIKSRLDPAQSIMGGAAYYKSLYERISEEVPEPDRTWFALAAYNVGIGHVRDARSLAEQLDKDPNSWSDMQQVLPLLSQKKYYKDLKHGYARGREPVLYVQRIRDYEDILRQKLKLAEISDE